MSENSKFVGKVIDKIIWKVVLTCAKCLFNMKWMHISGTKRKQLWEQKKNKYYDPLLYWGDRKIFQFIPKLLRAEWNQQIVILPRIVVVISTRCTLKCKYCGEFIPYFNQKQDLRTEYVLKDLEQLFNQMEYICTLEFIGGEPFLHNDLDIFLKKVNQYNSRIGKVEITTNATVPIPDKLLTILKNQKIEILISHYKVNSRKVRELKEILKRERINYRSLDAKYWTDSGKIHFNGKSRKSTYEMFMHCYASRDCRTLYKGKFLLCSRGPYMLEQGYHPNCLDIYINNLCSNLYTFYLQSGYATCKYCRHNEKKIPIAEQL